MLSGLEQQMIYLGQYYPSLYRLLLIHSNQTERLEEYESSCKAFEDDHERYSLYVYGYFFPWLEAKRANGELTKGGYSLINFIFIDRKDKSRSSWSRKLQIYR